MTIPLMRSSLLNEHATLDKLADWLRSHPDKLSMGPLTEQFEREFAAWQGRKYAVMVNSGSSANLVLLQALQSFGLLGTEVGVSALTWATNVMPIMQLGMTPIPVDVDPVTLNVKHPWDILSGMDALFITNALGLVSREMVIIQDWADQHNIVLIEDNCESLGSVFLNGVKAGNFGLASTFSFFVAHHMSTIEGGMICTDDPVLADLLIMTRANGWARNLARAADEKLRYRYDVRSDFDAAYTFYVPGFNVRPTEIAAFLGLEQLKLLDANLRDRALVFEGLERCAVGNPDLIPLDHGHMQVVAPFCFPVICKTPELRAKYISRFAAAGVEIRPIIAGNITRQPFWTAALPAAELPGADFVSERGFYFGIYPDLTIENIETLMACLMGG